MARLHIKDFRVLPNSQDFNLLKVPTTFDGRAYKDSDGYERKLRHLKEKMAGLQELLYAGKRRGIVVVLQAMDAAGKDGLVHHVMTGLNPQGCTVTNFKRPTPAEFKEHYLARHERALPDKGVVAIWNRSHYEEVGVVRVRPTLLEARGIKPTKAGERFWRARLQEIKEWEAQIDRADVPLWDTTRGDVTMVKMFLHVSKEEQARRLLERAQDPAKHWKFNPVDMAERKQWKEYMQAYSKAIAATSTDRAPWYVIPADDKPTARLIAARIINHHLGEEDLSLPAINAETRQAIKAAAKALKKELKK